MRELGLALSVFRSMLRLSNNGADALQELDEILYRGDHFETAIEHKARTLPRNRSMKP